MLATPLFNGQGLGNQLANYVTVRCLAEDKGFDFGVMFPERFKGHLFMKLNMGMPVIGGDIPVEGQLPSALPYGFNRYYRERTALHETGADVSGYDLELMSVEDNTLIHGLLQGEKYFKHRKHEVNEWLKVEPLEMADNMCVINFRGGEYKYVKDFFLPHSYWQKAIDIMLSIDPTMQFEVHTDDPETAKVFFPSCPIIRNIGLNWRSVRYAKYLILSNSSFGWFPAWLNDAKLILAPKYWGRYNRGFWSLEQNETDKFCYI